MLLSIALLIVVAFNAIVFTSRQLQINPVEPIRPRPGFAERLGRAIQFRTIATGSVGGADGDAFGELRTFLAEAFPDVHQRLELEVFGGSSLLYRWEGAEPSRTPILLMSHIDVVPVEAGTEEDWTYPPFSGEIADGFIWGRGALDVKCGALGLLEAVEGLLGDGFRPGCDVYLALGHDEEILGKQGNQRIAEALRERGVHFRFVLDEGGGITEGILDGIDAPVAFVGIAEKGYATISLKAEGTGGHGSMPPQHTAIGRLATAIHRLESRPPPARIEGATTAMLDYLGPEMPWPRRAALANRWLTSGLIARQFSGKPSLNALIRTTLATNVVRGGETENLLPKRAEALLNVRLLPGETADSALEAIERVVDDPGVACRLVGVGSEPSAISSVESVAFETLQRTIAEVYPGAVVSPGLSMVATDSRHYAPIADDIYRFMPLRVTTEDLERIHGTDERIAVDDYEALIGFLDRLIRNASDSEAPKSGATGRYTEAHATARTAMGGES